jgi:TonB family protein
MTSGVRSANARELQRLLCFAAASAALHALTLGVYVPAGASRSASAPPLARTLHATLLSSVNGASRESVPLPQAPISAEASQPEQKPPGHEGGSPDAPRLPMPDKWYTASELDARAEPVTAVEFAYPPKLERMIARVEVALFIDERGHVRKAQVLNAEPEKLFDEAALSGWRNVRFSPAMRGGVPVKSEKIVQVDFQPELSLR